MTDVCSPVAADRLIALESGRPETLVNVDRKRTLVIIPFSPVEYHGDHLTFSTDLILAEAFSRASAERFLTDNPSWNAVLYPVVPMGADCVPHPGSVAIPGRVLEISARALARHFIGQGFLNIVLLSGHGGVNHDRALERACRKLNRTHRRQGVRVIAPLGRVMFKLWAEGVRERLNPLLDRKISPEEEGDFLYELHGGWWETSMVLAYYPERMNEAYRTAPDFVPKVRPSLKLLIRLLIKILPRRHGDLLEEASELILVGTSWFWGRTGPGYLGFPSRARPEMGRAVTQIAGEGFAKLFKKIFVERGDAREAESVYSVLDLLNWYAAGAAGLVVAIVALIVLL